MTLKDYSVRDNYTYPDSPVLISRKDIRDGERLEQVEANAVYLRGAQLLLRPIGAVSILTISGSSTFGFSQYIERHLTSELAKVATENFLVGLSRRILVERLTYFLL